MDLGLAMAGANAFFKDQQAQEIRDRERQRYEWEKQRAEAEMGLLPDRTTAERSRLQLSDATSRSGMETLPGQTANTVTQQRITAGTLAGEERRQPQTEATKDIRATMDSNQAASDFMSQGDKLTTERNHNTVAAAMSNLDVEELPRTLAQKRLTNEISQADSDIMLGAKLSDLIDAGDTNSIVRLLNAQKRTIQDPKIQSLPDVASVSKAKDANGTEYLVLKDAQGKEIMARPIEAYRAAKASLSKIEYKSVDAGDSLVRVQGGKVTPVYTAPESAKSTAAHQGPLQRDVNYLVTEHGMSKDRALQYLNQAKTQSKQQFVLEMTKVLTKEDGKPPTKEQIDAFKRMHDRVMEEESNSSNQPKVPSAEIRGVLGIPDKPQ